LPTGQGQQIIQEIDFSVRGVRSRPGPLNRKGDARSQKLKVACVPCNTGWMSKLQDRTKPVLLPLLLREPKSIAGWDQNFLAVWLTMFTMVYETTIPEYAATTAHQRITFKEQIQPPEHWIFWCAPFDGKSAPAIQSGFASKDRGPIVGSDTPDIYKASLTLCGAGAVSFAIFSVNSGEAHQAFSEFVTDLVERAGFARLWPVPGKAITTTEKRLVPLGYSDLCIIKDAIRAGVGVAHHRDQRR
jgi:hypothetical protein